MTTITPWHSTVATARPLYHDDTRCREGAAIALKDRRLGDGGRESCPSCLGFLIEALKAGGSPHVATRTAVPAGRGKWKTVEREGRAGPRNQDRARRVRRRAHASAP